MAALSVSISTSSSPRWTCSPSRLSQRKIVPSSIVSDRRGITTSLIARPPRSSRDLPHLALQVCLLHRFLDRARRVLLALALALARGALAVDEGVWRGRRSALRIAPQDAERSTHDVRLMRVGNLLQGLGVGHGDIRS